MNTHEPIICGIDGSPGSRRAAATASAVAEHLRSSLVLVHVVPPRPPMPRASVPMAGYPVGTAQMAELDQAEIDSAFAIVEDQGTGADVEHVVERGHAAGRLAELAETRNARLIVVGTRGTGAVRSALLGSVSQELAADASRPVLVVRDSPNGALGPGPVVCGIDGSDQAQVAAGVAARMADDLHAGLTLVSVVPPGAERDDFAAWCAATLATAASGSHVERAAISGDPADELVRAAADRNAALLVVGSRGRGPVRAALLGSISAAVTRRSRCPVLIVPQGASDAELASGWAPG